MSILDSHSQLVPGADPYIAQLWADNRALSAREDRRAARQTRRPRAEAPPPLSDTPFRAVDPRRREA